LKSQLVENQETSGSARGSARSRAPTSESAGSANTLFLFRSDNPDQRGHHGDSYRPEIGIEHDAFPINGTDYVELYVGNAKQSAHYYRSAFGYQLVAYCGPETGVRDRASYLLQQGKIRLVLTTAMSSLSPIATPCPCATAMA
jgi:hypothetical protein